MMPQMGTPVTFARGVALAIWRRPSLPSTRGAPTRARFGARPPRAIPPDLLDDLPYLENSTPDLLRALGAAASTSIAHVLARGVTLFTMMYCGLNWWFYRGVGVDTEKRDGDDPADEDK